MYCGFDYGSSNCAIGVWDEEVKLVPLEQGNTYLPSSLYALHPSFIVQRVEQGLQGDAKGDYRQSRIGLLNQIPQAKSEFDLTDDECQIHIGRDAIEQYIECPEEGHYIKSPKSFFGAVGLKQQQINFFEDIASAMFMTLKQRAELHLGHELTQTVIGRPVNFQSIGGEESNQQAISILTGAAKRAGFRDVAFLYEPLAAGIDYETSLSEDKVVLVVDVGGGTTDCSLVQMGPSHRTQSERQQDFLAHTGKRVGGNDLDINLAFHGLMPLFGSLDTFKSGKPMPNQPFWNACKINDVILQSEFYSDKNARDLAEILKEAQVPERFSRLLSLQHNKQGHQLVRSAELAKIALSNQTDYEVILDYITGCDNQVLTQAGLKEAIAICTEQVVSLAKDAISQANVQPDLIYLTGGSAQSPILKAALAQTFGDIEMVNGDHFGSVTAGLTKYAKQLFA